MSTFNMSSVSLIKVITNGVTANGPISIPGMKVGDAIVSVVPYDFAPGFEQVVSVDDELQQNTVMNVDYSSLSFTFYLIRGV